MKIKHVWMTGDAILEEWKNQQKSTELRLKEQNIAISSRKRYFWNSWDTRAWILCIPEIKANGLEGDTFPAIQVTAVIIDTCRVIISRNDFVMVSW